MLGGRGPKLLERYKYIEPNKTNDLGLIHNAVKPMIKPAIQGAILLAEAIWNMDASMADARFIEDTPTEGGI